MVEDTFQKLLEEYNIEKNSNTMDLMNTTIEEMTPQQRLDLINKMLEDLKSYEDYYKLEDIGKNIDRYLNGEIPYSEVNLNIPIVKPLNFPEDKIEEKKSYFEKKLYDLVLHENMRDNSITQDKHIAEIFTPIINRKVENLKQSIMAPEHIMDVITFIDNYPGNENNPRKYLNVDLFLHLYFLENNDTKFFNNSDFYDLAKLRIEKKDLISNLKVNKSSMKKLKKKKYKIYAIISILFMMIPLGIFLPLTVATHENINERDKDLIKDSYIYGVYFILLQLLSYYFCVLMWKDKPEYKELLKLKEIEEKDLAKLKKVLHQIKEFEERELVATKLETLKKDYIDKELEKNKPTGLNI